MPPLEPARHAPFLNWFRQRCASLLRVKTQSWIASILLLISLGARAGAASNEDIEFFEKKVRPLLAANCLSCHNATGSSPMGGLRLTSRESLMKGGDRGPAVAITNPDASLLLRAVGYAEKNLQMPPKGKLREEEIAVLTDWVKRGAPWSAAVKNPIATSSRAFDIKARARHWAWQPIARPGVPVVKQKNWARTPVDNFLLSGLEARDIKPAAPADRRTLLRRVTFDLIGLPPTPDEIHAFLADTSPNAYEKVVERLLASPHYGERWARHWMDLVRYGETNGHEWDIEKTGVFPYRDYVIRALNADLPYHQFVREQIAGDLMLHPRLNPTEHYNESILGTGFYWLGASIHSPVDLRDDEADRIDNQIDVLSKAFLGVGVGCARCHDHKFDAISSKDYYALYGFLKSTRLQYTDVAPALAPEVSQGLTAVSAEIQSTLQNRAKVDFGSALDLTSSIWRQRMATATGDPGYILYPVAVLTNSTRSPEDFRKQRDDLVRQLQDQADRTEKSAKNFVWLADFRGNSHTTKQWYLTGDAFAVGVSDAPTARMDAGAADKPRAVFDTGVPYSARFSDRLTGVLRSPTFTITKPTMLYHLAGRDCRVRLVIEGYQLIRDPLYGSLAFDINRGDKLEWYTQGVRDWMGHRAYVEIVDDGAGWFAADRIGMSEGDTPPEAPNALIAKVVSDPAIRSQADLLRTFAELFQKAARAAAQVTGNATPVEPALNAILRWEEETASPSPASSSPIAALLEQRGKLEARIPNFQPAAVAADGQGEDERVHVRGNYRSLGVAAHRHFLEACDWNAPVPPLPGSGRQFLADRMTAPTNPLLARVMVNRIWQHHFGEGIVRTPDDFGFMGQRPTHPALLDWLASTFQREGWSLKKMHRLMVLSSAYRMASHSSLAAEAVDPQNKLLHRMPVRRLEAECIRDAMLAVSGRLDPKLYGPPVMPNLTAFTPGRGAPNSGPVDGDGRRSIYISIRRNFLIPMFQAFDFPTPLSTIGRRSVSNVPAQALTLMNNRLVVEQAQVWARRIAALPGTPEQHIDTLYEMAFGRLPSQEERASDLAFITSQSYLYGGPNGEQAWSDLCHVLFNVKEFIFVP